MDWILRGFRQFDAPVSIVVTYDRALEPATISHFDLGAITYGLCLAAWDRGLGTVINGQGIMQSEVVRKHAKIPEDQAIMTCIVPSITSDDHVHFIDGAAGGYTKAASKIKAANKAEV